MSDLMDNDLGMITESGIIKAVACDVDGTMRITGLNRERGARRRDEVHVYGVASIAVRGKSDERIEQRPAAGEIVVYAVIIDVIRSRDDVDIDFDCVVSEERGDLRTQDVQKGVVEQLRIHASVRFTQNMELEFDWADKCVWRVRGEDRVIIAGSKHHPVLRSGTNAALRSKLSGRDEEKSGKQNETCHAVLLFLDVDVILFFFRG